MMLRVVFVLFILQAQCYTAHAKAPSFISSPGHHSTDVLDEPSNTVPLWYQLREEAVAIREEAQNMRSDAYNTMKKAFQMKEEAMESREAVYKARMEVETNVIETLSLLRSQAAATTLYVQEVRSTLTSVKGRLDQIEDRMDDLERNLEDGFEDLNDKLDKKMDIIGERLAVLEGISEVSVEKNRSCKRGSWIDQGPDF